MERLVQRLYEFLNVPDNSNNFPKNKISHRPKHRSGQIVKSMGLTYSFFLAKCIGNFKFYSYIGTQPYCLEFLLQKSNFPTDLREGFSQHFN